MKIDKKTYEAMPADLQAMFDKLPNPARDEATAGMPETKSGVAVQRNRDGKVHNQIYGAYAKPPGGDVGYADANTSAARFFQCCEQDGDEPNRYYYCAKSSRRERDAGLEGWEERAMAEHAGRDNCMNSKRDLRYKDRPSAITSPARNPHPCLKPLSLTRYLATLIRPPEPYLDDAALLVPYAGVGSECIGAILAGWRNLTAIELEPEYCEIWRARVGWWAHMHALTGESEPKAILDAARKIEKEGAVQMAMEDVHGH